MSNHRPLSTRAYTKWTLLQLFMVSVFPIHLWALLMGFRDFSWVALRTNVWDGLGLLAYSLAFALLESLGIFLLLVAIGFLFPGRMEADKRLAFLGVTFLVLAIWAILGQIYSGLGNTLPGWLVSFLVRTQHPFRYTWLLVFLLAVVSTAAPLVLIARRDKFKNRVIDLFERLSTVSFLYIFFDVISLVIIVIRNVHF